MRASRYLAPPFAPEYSRTPGGMRIGVLVRKIDLAADPRVGGKIICNG